MSSSRTQKRLYRCRLGDGVLQNQNATSLDYEAILQPWSSCALSIEASLEPHDQPVYWLIVTDSARLKAWALETFTAKILFGTEEPLVHSTVGGLGGAAVDNWLLGMCTYQVISELSQFGRSAALRLRAASSVFTIQQDWQQWAKVGQSSLDPVQGHVRRCEVQRPDKPSDLIEAHYGI